MNTPNTEPSTLPGQPLTSKILQSQNRAFRGTGGSSQDNCGYGFHPAFLDTETGITYLSRFANGSPAPIHVLESLPDTVVLRWDAHGRVVEVKSTLNPGRLTQP